jgi:hypothetical protein
MSKQKKRGALAERQTPEHVDKATAESGWFLDQLVMIEGMIWGRWPYWVSCLLNESVRSGEEWAIPQIPFHQQPSGPTSAAAGMRERDAVPESMIEYLGTGGEAISHVQDVFLRATMHSSGHLRDIIDWWLWGFGSARLTERPRLDPKVAVTMYHELRLELMIAHPTGWGTIMVHAAQGEGYGQGSAWFPTPLTIADCMVRMTFGTSDVDNRLLTVNEPCCGTGVFLLAASNHSLRLWAMDVDYLMCAITEFMGYLFIPWLVRSGDGIIREFGETTIERKVRLMREILSGKRDDESVIEETPEPSVNLADARKQMEMFA